MQAQHSAARHPVPSSARARRGAGPASEPTAYEVVLPELPEQHGRAQVLRRVGVVLQMPGGKVRVLPCAPVARCPMSYPRSLGAWTPIRTRAAGARDPARG